MNSPHEILGIPLSATEEEIKKAFRKKAMQHHPDHGGDSNKFMEAQRAYKLLCEKKNITGKGTSIYDQVKQAWGELTPEQRGQVINNVAYFLFYAVAHRKRRKKSTRRQK